MHVRIPILAAGALLAVATAACAAQPHRTAARVAAPPVAPATVAPVAAPLTPAPTVSATPSVSMTSAGTYVQVADEISVDVYVLRPGATTWTLVGKVPTTSLPYSFPNYRVAPSGLIASNWNETRLSVAPTNGPTGGSAPLVVATAAAGGHMCRALWNGASNRLLYVVSTKDWMTATLYTVGADGTGRRALTGATDPGICRATWSANGATIAYVKNYALHLPIAEYHEAMVIRNGHTSEAHLHLSNKVHLESVLAIAPDGRHALVGTKTVQPDGSCGDGGPDGFAVVDLVTGAAHPITLRGPGYAAPSLVFTFDTAGHLIADEESGAADSATESLELFDLRGHYLRTLPKIVIADRSTFSVVAVVA